MAVPACVRSPESRRASAPLHTGEGGGGGGGEVTHLPQAQPSGGLHAAPLQKHNPARRGRAGAAAPPGDRPVRVQDVAVLLPDAQPRPQRRHLGPENPVGVVLVAPPAVPRRGGGQEQQRREHRQRHDERQQRRRLRAAAAAAVAVGRGRDEPVGLGEAVVPPAGRRVVGAVEAPAAARGAAAGAGLVRRIPPAYVGRGRPAAKRARAAYSTRTVVLCLGRGGYARLGGAGCDPGSRPAGRLSLQDG